MNARGCRRSLADSCVVQYIIYYIVTFRASAKVNYSPRASRAHPNKGESPRLAIKPPINSPRDRRTRSGSYAREKRFGSRDKCLCYDRGSISLTLSATKCSFTSSNLPWLFVILNYNSYNGEEVIYITEHVLVALESSNRYTQDGGTMRDQMSEGGEGERDERSRSTRARGVSFTGIASASQSLLSQYFNIRYGNKLHIDLAARTRPAPPPPPSAALHLETARKPPPQCRNGRSHIITLNDDSIRTCNIGIARYIETIRDGVSGREAQTALASIVRVPACYRLGFPILKCIHEDPVLGTHGYARFNHEVHAVIPNKGKSPFILYYPYIALTYYMYVHGVGLQIYILLVVRISFISLLGEELVLIKKSSRD